MRGISASVGIAFLFLAKIKKFPVLISCMFTEIIPGCKTEKLEVLSMETAARDGNCLF